MCVLEMQLSEFCLPRTQKAKTIYVVAFSGHLILVWQWNPGLAHGKQAARLLSYAPTLFFLSELYSLLPRLAKYTTIFSTFHPEIFPLTLTSMIKIWIQTTSFTVACRC